MDRNLVLIRHTKSDWSHAGLTDFERPLRADRTDDAKRMSKKLKQLKLYSDLIICSPAKRTRQTSEFFCHALEYDYNRVQFEMRLYESSAEDYLQVIREVNADVQTLLLFGHNPSITHLVHYFLPKHVVEMPTTGVVWISFQSPDWEVYSTTPLEGKGFFTPKTI
jgi:phosphohistidine phosphatase